MKNKTIKELREQGLGYKTIAQEIGSTKEAVKRYCQRHGLGGFIGQPKGRPVQEQQCRQCGQTFKPIGNDRTTFCSRGCSAAYITEHKKPKNKCLDCGTEISKEANRCRDCSVQYRRSNTVHKEPNIKHCRNCGESYEQHNGAIHCSDRCRRNYNSRTNEIARRHKLKDNGPVDYTITLDILVKRDQGICQICREPVDMTKHHNNNWYGSIDHITPVAKGGLHQWDNVQLAHRKCNSKKSDTHESPHTLML